VVVCPKGQKLSKGATAWLRHEGVTAETRLDLAPEWATSAGRLARLFAHVQEDLLQLDAAMALFDA